MSKQDNSHRDPQPESPQVDPLEETTEGVAEQATTPDAGKQEPLTPEQEIQNLRDELEQANQRLLRVSADYQNFVRRAQQNLTDACQQQVMDMTKALVTVLDHFDRTLEVDVENIAGQSLLEGVQIVRDELLRTFEQFGVVRLEVNVGDVFDPNRHEALMRQAGEVVEANHVVAQLQPGYILNEKTLRPAQVSIAE